MTLGRYSGQGAVKSGGLWPAGALLRAAEEELCRAHLDLGRVTPAREFRRGCELVSDLSLLVVATGILGSGITPGGQMGIHLTDTKPISKLPEQDEQASELDETEAPHEMSLVEHATCRPARSNSLTLRRSAPISLG